MFKLFTAEQIRNWDNYTISNEPISSINLMERAATAFVNWFVKKHLLTQQIHVFCGPGNNGGDGLAISRILLDKGYDVIPYIINPNNKLSNDCDINLNRLATVIQLTNISQISMDFFSKKEIIIDALFGTGLSRPLSDYYKTIIEKIASTNCIKIAVDIPSGMYCDRVNNSNDIIFKADTIVSFQIPKRSFYFIENKPIVKHLKILNIGLSTRYLKDTNCNWYAINSYAEIPNFDTCMNITISREIFEQQFDIPFQSEKTLQLLIKKANEQQLTFIIKDSNIYIITPKNNVYFILN